MPTMSPARVPWKEAATVILAARSGRSGALTSVGNQAKRVKVAPAQHGGHASSTRMLSSFDYKILLLKRSSKSSFFPNAYVFPGGTVSQRDFSNEWHDYLCASLGIETLDPEKLGLYAGVSGSPRPPIYSDNSSSIVPAEVAFRICAVRETFEESGILLYTDRDTVNDETKESLRTKVPRSVLSQWRDEVNNDEGKFIEMMKALDILPDIWSLYDWVNWLTPVQRGEGAKILPKARRFDTIFYLSVLHKHIEEVCDDKEIVASEWMTPGEALRQYIHGDFFLAPPQAYELLKLCGVPELVELTAHAKERSVLGLERWMPIRCNLLDGILFIFPGDDLYPAKPDYVEQERLELDMTIEEANLKFKNHHRSIMQTGPVRETKVSKPLSCGHLSPVQNLPFTVMDPPDTAAKL